MEMKWAALVAVSALASSVFVGCSCARSVDNGENDSAVIQMENDVTISSEAVTTVLTTDALLSNTAEMSVTTGTETSDAGGSTTTGTTISRVVQFAGNANARRTTKQNVVTRVVVVTVTAAKPVVTTTKATPAPVITTIPVETTTEATTVTTEATVNMPVNAPDATFTPAQDLCFTVDGKGMQVGAVQPELINLAKETSESAPVYGGTAAYNYICEGYNVLTEVMLLPDGTSQEQITEITISNSKACTNKGITVGSSVDSILAAYGTENCEITDASVYRYKTAEGLAIDFCTDGTTVTQIRYYKTAVTEG